jgi:NADH dehydrogenase FAD-containing subunit
LLVANCNKLRVIVVSPSNHFVFTPMLVSVSILMATICK